MSDPQLAALWGLGGLEDATEDVLRALASRFHVRPVAAGETVCAVGDASRHLWVTLSGEVECVLPGIPGGARTAALGPGKLFGHVGVYTRAPRQFTVRATGDGTLLELDDGAADALLREPGMVGRAFRHMLLHAVLHQLHTVDATLLRLAVAATRARPPSEDPR